MAAVWGAAAGASRALIKLSVNKESTCSAKEISRSQYACVYSVYSTVDLARQLGDDESEIFHIDLGEPLSESRSAGRNIA